MPTPEDYALAAASSANDALLSALLATAKSVLTSEDEVAAAQWAADAYDYMLNCQGGVTSISSSEIIVNNALATVLTNTTTTNNNVSLISASAAQVALDKLAAASSAITASDALAATVVIQTNVNNTASDFSSKYLGDSATNPVSNQIGALYWNTVSNEFRVWNGTTWENVITTSFDGIVNGGTSNTPLDTLQVRRDTASAWSIANPTLALGELGFETDTKLFKFGDGTTIWNSLSYGKTNSSNVIGFENVNNTSDANKPVSTLQATAIATALTTAKDYTDSVNLNHLIDVGDYSVSLTNAYPITGGTGLAGLILRGNVFNCSSTGTINSYLINEGDSLRALVDNPSQSDTDWLITTKPVTNDKPYVVILNIPGLVISDFIYPSHVFTLSVSFPIDFTLSKAKSRIYTSNTYIFYLQKNGVTFGELTFPSGSVIGTFTAITSTTFIAGDTLEIKSQSNPDASLSDISISFFGSRI